MFGIREGKTIISTVAILVAAVGAARAQSGGSVFGKNYHIGFERPESWGLKYFASTSLLSGLPASTNPEDHVTGAITVGLEMDWLPQLDAGQRTIGFNGKAPQDLNKAPVFARAVVRVGLPHKFSAVVAVPPTWLMFGVHAQLLAFGVEHPILEREHWTLGWRGYGQVGSVKGAFTCTSDAAEYAPGSAENPTRCLAESADVATLRYAGSEFEFSYRIPSHPKVIPHAAAGGNFVDAAFQTHAPVVAGIDETRLWTRGGTFSGTAGVTYLVTRRAAFTVDAFYSPLWVTRSPGAPRTNDGLFNVRALVSYTFR